MVPFHSDEDLPDPDLDPDLDHELEPELDPEQDPAAWDQPVPELPAELVEAEQLAAEQYQAGTWVPLTEPDCRCRHCQPPVTEHGDSGLGEFWGAAEEFGAHFRAAQASTALAWKAAAALHEQVLADGGPNAAEHVGSHLALLMGVHTRTGTSVCFTAVRAARDVPQLAELVLAGKITDKHVSALLDEVGKWTDTDDQARFLLEQTVARLTERADRYGWPTPGEMKKALQRVALLHDMRAAEKRRKSVAERRGVQLSQSGAGAAVLVIEGPDVQLIQAYRAIQERAEAMKHLEGDTRSRAAREYDAAVELLTLDADMPEGGGISARPTTGLDGHPTELVVRGAHVAVLTPYSVLHGGDLELAEVPGFGYLLPATARELAQHADAFRRVAVHAHTGEVLAVDDAAPGPDRARRTTRHQHPTPGRSSTQVPGLHDQHPAVLDPTHPLAHPQPHEPPDPDDEDEGDHGGGGGGPDRDPPDSPPSSPTLSTHSAPDHQADPVAAQRSRAATRSLRDALRAAPPPEPPPQSPTEPAPTALSPETLARLRELAERKVIWRDLNTSAYRVPGRLRRFVEHRDRTCCFPGCTVPGSYCDIDHREEWPRGGTHQHNCHCLCRKHHRAKQFYFTTVSLDPTTGDTCWTTPDGTTYRRPPPRY